MAVVKFSSKHVVGVWELHSSLYLFGKHLLNTHSVPSSALSTGINAEPSDMPFWDLQTDGRNRHRTDEQIKRFGIRLHATCHEGSKQGEGRTAGKTLQRRWSGKSSEKARPEIGGAEERHFLTEGAASVGSAQGNVSEETENHVRNCA